MMPTVRYAIGDKTVNACAGRGCGAGQARSTQDLARRLIGIKCPAINVSRKGKPPNVIRSGTNCRENHNEHPYD
jgi:hypothetical protein